MIRCRLSLLPVLSIAALSMCGGGVALGEQPDSEKYVSRAEHEKLKQEFADFKKMMAQTLQANQAKQDKAPGVSDQETQEYLQYIETELGVVKELAMASQTGSTRFLVAGFATAGYTDRGGTNSSFSAGFNPIFLWELNDRLLFEGELELELVSTEAGDETETSLDYAHASYLVNDYVTVGAGKFLTPFGIFSERLHPTWINKMPDAPLAFSHDGLAPMSSTGVYIRGGVPVGETMKGNYAFYLSNGPKLKTGVAEPDEAGFLAFSNYQDSDNNKAIGGRVGFLPIPELEVGYSFQYAKVQPDDFTEVDVALHAVDVSYVRDSESLGGVIDARFEWVWSDVDDATYDADGSLGFGPTRFNNSRDGGYAQIAYRPSRSGNKVIKKLEGVVRYDWLNNPNDAPESFDEQRYTFGLNYWLTPSTVLKTAYQMDNKDSGASDDDAFLVQAAIGF
jgi:hypothetical protein